MSRQKVKMIESYYKINDSDYQYNDNHGILIRCRECVYAKGKSRSCKLHGCEITELDYCSKAVKKEMS